MSSCIECSKRRSWKMCHIDKLTTFRTRLELALVAVDTKFSKWLSCRSETHEDVRWTCKHLCDGSGHQTDLTQTKDKTDHLPNTLGEVGGVATSRTESLIQSSPTWQAICHRITAYPQKHHWRTKQLKSERKICSMQRKTWRHSSSGMSNDRAGWLTR